MKAVRLNELGGPENLHIEDIPQPSPGPGEVLVRIKRAAFNRRDVFITQNLYPGIVLPRTLGSDGCGEVAALGEGCRRHGRRHRPANRLGRRAAHAQQERRYSGHAARRDVRAIRRSGGG